MDVGCYQIHRKSVHCRNGHTTGDYSGRAGGVNQFSLGTTTGAAGSIS